MPLPSLFIFAFVASFTPGPNNIMAMTIAGKCGFKETIPFDLGVMAGFMLLLTLSTMLGAFLQSVIPQVQRVMSFIGAAYMLYLCYAILRDKPKEENNKAFKKPGFFTACLLQFINPKGVLYSITVMSESLKINDTLPVICLFILAFTVIAGASMITWTFLGAVLEKFFAKYRKVINGVMVLLLVYCAVMMILPH